MHELHVLLDFAVATRTYVRLERTQTTKLNPAESVLQLVHTCGLKANTLCHYEALEKLQLVHTCGLKGSDQADGEAL